MGVWIETPVLNIDRDGTGTTKTLMSSILNRSGSMQVSPSIILKGGVPRYHPTYRYASLRLSSLPDQRANASSVEPPTWGSSVEPPTWGSSVEPPTWGSSCNTGSRGAAAAGVASALLVLLGSSSPLDAAHATTIPGGVTRDTLVVRVVSRMRRCRELNV